MYGQGGYNPQFGRGPHTPLPSAYQQLPVGHPSPYLQQGPLVPPTSVVQHHPHGPPHVGPPAASIYQHVCSAQAPSIDQAPPSGIPNTSQSYLQPSTSATGVIPLSHMYQTVQHNSQQALHLGTQNVYHRPLQIPPPPPPLGQLHLPPNRVLPPPPIPSQAQALFRPLIHPLPQHPGGQGLQNIPPPPISNFVATASIGSIVPPEAPPPPPTPPFSPPPVPPSPPQTSDDDIVAPDEVKENVPVLQGLLNQEGRSGSEGPLVGDGVLSKGSMMLDLSPPPRKPTEEKVVQKIEVLCHSIAENGPDYEDMTRQNEYGNPEFEFLFGGEPGSEAAIAHEYFLWMKKKYLLAHKSNVETSDPPLTSSGNNSLSQTDNSVVAAVSHPSPDSDMEMEDDITQPDPDQGVSYSIGGLNCKSDLINIEPNVKEQLSASQSSKECSPSKDVLSEKVSFRGSPVLDEGVPIVPVATMNSTGAAEQLLASSLDKSGTALSNDTSLLKACAAAEEICSEKSSGLCNKSSSPFRLIQEYASDDGSENNADPCLENVSPVTVSLSVGHTNLHRDAGFNLEADIGSKNLSESENEFVQGSESRVLCKGEEFSVDSPRKFKGAVISSTASGMTGELVRKKPESVTIKHAASFEALQKDCGGTYVADTFTDKLQKNNEEKNLSSTETKQKVDKFGRLLRKGASDSDSDDLQYVGRHRTRGRSWSRSQSRSRSRSPPDRRRRRSPRKRREKRSLSRSWSPRNRRSRSRSPTYRRVADFIGHNTRQDKGRSPVCFDFLRGRCYRGRSCRFLHHDSHKGDISRRHRSRQGYLEDLPSSKTSIINKEIKHIGQAVPDHEHDYVKNTEMLLSEDTPGSSFHASGGGNIDQKKEDSSSDALRSGFGSNVAHLIDSRRVSSESYGQTAAKAQTQVVQEMPRGLIPINEDYEVAEDFHKKPIGPNDASQIVVSPSKKSGSQQSQFSPSGPVPHNNDGLPQQTDNSSIADASPDRTSKTFLNELPVSKASTNATQLTPSQLNSQGASDPHRTLPPSDYKLNPNSLPEESFPPYMLPNQNSNFYGPPGSSWTTLPPPPPLPSHNLTPGVSSQIQHCHLPPRNDFGSQSNSGAYTTELPAYSLGGGLQQQAYPPVNEHHQPLLHSAMPMYNPLSQQFKGHSLLREDCFRQPPMQGFSAANSLPTGNNYPQTGSFLYELSENKMQPFSWDSLPPGEILKSSSQINPYLQQQLPSCSIQHSAADNLYCLPGNSRSSSRYPPDVLDTNQPSCMPNFRESRSSTCYNSYASAFEGPLNSKLSSDKFRTENDATNNCTSFTMNHAPADGRGVSSVGLKQGTSSPTSTKAVGQNFPSSAGDQYDPLFDSIEPSSKLSKKSDYVRKWEPANDSDIMLRLKPLDIEENNQRDEVGAVDPATSVVNEECGETADAEVDDNRSPSDPADIANMNSGEFEIDQIKSPGKNTKRKESRSLKLFKVALAEFVKEVLKPSWRQGNMSKEAFKTIVKKTVDKVSGAMRSHQIPKSRAKINQYIDSSQRKLTKLVMGYVDKYVKV